MEKIYEPINWEDFPSKKTKINAENLNKMDSAINELDGRIVEMDDRMTPITNLLATEPGSPLDATMGKELNDKIETLGGFEPVIDETTGKITGYKTKIGGADTVYPFKSVVHCGSYTESGSFNIADYGLQNVAVENFIFVPSAFSSYNTEQAQAKSSKYNAYYTSRNIFKKATFELDSDTGAVTFTCAKMQAKPMVGTNATNATSSAIASYITNELPGDIYYMG